MCLITISNEPLMAEKAIEVFKGLRGNMISLCYGFHYKRGDLYVLDREIKALPCSEDYVGFCDDLDERWGRSKNVRDMFYVTHGFHATLSRDRLEKGWWASIPHTVYEAIIPAGSLYFLDPTGLIVSDNIIIL